MSLGHLGKNLSTSVKVIFKNTARWGGILFAESHIDNLKKIVYLKRTGRIAKRNKR